jgi:hypothetical protein
VERKITRHSSRLSEAALDQGFHVGQRVRTLDGLTGRVLMITESFSPGNTEYQVVLDDGQGGGTYLGSQLRPVGEDFGGGHQAPAYLPAGVTAAYITEDQAREAFRAQAELERIASEDYPEMGDILTDRPDPGRQFTVIGSRHQAVPIPGGQLKLFHQEHELPDTCPGCGHERRDPEHNFLHYRHVHTERGDYEPDECEHCGHDLNAYHEHEQAHHDWLTSQDWHTDWDHEGPGDTIHRGISASLPPDVHAVVHDESRPAHERAKALTGHLLSHENLGGSGLGNFFSGDPDVSKTYAETHQRRFGQHGEPQTPVMLHVHTPDREHFETDPDTLREWGVYSYHLAGNREVPIQNQAPLRIKGISWAPPGHRQGAMTHHTPEWFEAGAHHLDQDPAWTHHEFGGEGLRAMAALARPYQDTYSTDHNQAYHPGPMPQLYHGTNHPFEPGHYVEPGHPTHYPGAYDGMEEEAARYVHATPHIEQAWQHADNAVHEHGGAHHVYEVEPTGKVTWGDEAFPEDFGSDDEMNEHATRMSQAPFKVVRELPYNGEPLPFTRRTAASYADGVDPREQDYNGEPPVGGVYWGAPAQQAFVDEELGQPEDPMLFEPGGEDEEEPPGGLESTAAGLFPWNTPEGQKHMVFHMMHRHKYNLKRSQEAGGDIWDAHRALHEQGGQSHDHDWPLEDRFQPMIPVHKKLPAFRPEQGGGSENPRPTPTGLWRGGEIPEDHPLHPHWEDFQPRHLSDNPRAVLSSLASMRDEKGDRWWAYQNQFKPDTLHRGIHVSLPEHVHDYVHDEGVPREQRAQALAQHFADSGGLGMHWTPHVNIASRAIGNAVSEPGNIEDEDEGYGDDPYGEHPAHGTDVMFHVRKPGQKRIVRNPAVLEQHEIGWAHGRDEDEVPVKPGSPLRLQGISWKLHEPDYPLEPFEHHDFAKPMRHTSSIHVKHARVPWTPEQREQLHGWQAAPTATEGDFVNSNQFTNKMPEYAPEPDPESEFAEAVGPRAFTEMTARLAAHDVHDAKADEVYQLLAKKFPPESIAWVHDAKWDGPGRVPLDQIDTSNRDSWAASGNPKKVKRFQKKILKKEDKGKDPKPAILVRRPGKDTAMIADGHHRYMAEEALAADDDSREGLHAWTAHVDDAEGPWTQMHSSQETGPGDALDDGEEAPPPDGTGDDLAPPLEGPGQEPPGAGEEDPSLFEPGDAPGSEMEPGAEPGMNPLPGQPVPPAVVTGLPPLSQGGTPGPRTKNTAPIQPVTPVKPVSKADPGEPDPGEKDQALDSFEKAAGSAPFRFEFTASWQDVVAKARRIHREGGVRITASSGTIVIGEIKGDHAVYESGLQYYPGRPWSVMAFSCGCPWASFHQDADYPGRFAGRQCSHAYALGLAARERGGVKKMMFPDTAGWPEQVVTKSWPPWHPSDKAWAQEWKAPMTRRPIMGSLDAADPKPPAVTAARILLGAGEDPAAVAALLSCAGLQLTADQANAPWGSQNVIDDPPPKPYGATSPPEPDRDPGSYGPLSGPDPDNWGEIQDNSAIQMPLTSDAARHAIFIDTGASSFSSNGDYAHSDSRQAPGRYGAARQAAGPAMDTDLSDTSSGPATSPGSAATAGPSTEVTPRDPAGLRFEEALAAARHAFTASMNASAAAATHAFQDNGHRGCDECGLDHGDPVHKGHDVVLASVAEPQLEGALAELKDEPEPALDPEGLTATSEDAKAYNLARTLPHYPEAGSTTDSGRAQHPDQVIQQPGIGSADDPWSPDDPSIQTIGQAQSGGLDVDSSDVAVSGQGQEHPQEGENADIVAQFQRSAAAAQYAGGGGTQVGDSDIAAAARAFLKTADVLPQAEADELIREGRGTRARNLDLLDLQGTHYTEDSRLDDAEDDVIYA